MFHSKQTIHMKNIKKYILGMATALCLCQSCDVLDIDPTGNYSETTAFNSIKNLDLYVKGFYSIFYVNSQLYVDASCLMDDGASDLIKYSWISWNDRQLYTFILLYYCFRMDVRIFYQVCNW